MNLFDQLQEAMRGDADTVPDGFRTTEQWAKEWGVSIHQAQRLTAAGVKKGLLISKIYRVNIGTRLYPVPHYGPK